MDKFIITIGRECGSGGKYIGKELAKRFNIKCYDKEILHKVYERNGYSYSKLEQYDENKRSAFFKALEMLSLNSYDSIFEDDNCQFLISNAIKEIADNESCIIIGRNGNNILKGKNNVINIFIYSNDIEFKIRRKMDSKKISYEKANLQIKSTDKKRKKYYEYINKGHIWGDRKDYDYMIDSSVLGVEKTIDIIEEIIKKRYNI